MDTVLAGILTVPLHLTVEIGDRESLRNFYVTVALDPPDDVVGHSIEIRPAAMTLEFKFFTRGVPGTNLPVFRQGVRQTWCTRTAAARQRIRAIRDPIALVRYSTMT